MKRWFSVLLALFVLLMLSGCGEDSSREDAVTRYSKTEDAVEEPTNDPWGYDENRGYFVDDNAAPQMSGEGLKADLYEAYFTNNGYLYVQMKIGNGTDRVQRVDTVDVALYDPDTEAMIAGGLAELEEEVTVKVADVIDYAIYISPEHVKWAKDKVLPEVLSFEITIEHSPVEVE